MNGIGASIPMTAGGRVFYYSDYNPHGGKKVNTEVAWSCCTGTRPQAAADCCDLVYFKDKENLCVNLFVALHRPLVGPRQGGNFASDYTVSRGAADAVHGRSCEAGGLRPENPLSRLACRANDGESQRSGRRHQKGFAELGRDRCTWSNGDRLDVELPMNLRTSSFPGGRYPAALLFGPVCAGGACRGWQLREGDRPGASREIAGPSRRRAANLAACRRPGRPCGPFYAIRKATYYLYFDPDAPDRISHRALAYHGTGTSSPGFTTPSRPARPRSASSRGPESLVGLPF